MKPTKHTIKLWKKQNINEKRANLDILSSRVMWVFCFLENAINSISTKYGGSDGK